MDLAIYNEYHPNHLFVWWVGSDDLCVLHNKAEKMNVFMMLDKCSHFKFLQASKLRVLRIVPGIDSKRMEACDYDLVSDH